jgi:spermidine synthase
MPRADRSRRRSPGTVEHQVDLGTAVLAPDPDRPGAWLLSVDGTPQSHVDPADPTYLDFEYVRWLARLADAVAPAGEPLRVLHLGGGGCTLARYLAATRPRSGQLVVELDAALVELVRRHLPLPRAGIRVRTGDAREVLTGLRDAGYDLVVGDVFGAARVPAHLTSVQYLEQVARVLRPGGVYAANLPDGPPLRFAREQAATLRAVFPRTALVGSPQVLRGRRFGNLVLVGSTAPLPVAELSRHAAGDAFPARVLDHDELAGFAGQARPTDDARATPSPEPPGALFG